MVKRTQEQSLPQADIYTTTRSSGDRTWMEAVIKFNGPVDLTRAIAVANSAGKPNNRRNETQLAVSLVDGRIVMRCEDESHSFSRLKEKAEAAATSLGFAVRIVAPPR